MRIAAAFGGRPTVSFEFFPPRTPDAERQLFTTIERLAPLTPTYVSVTYGAGGATRRLTVDLVQRIKREIGLEAMAHLTCVGHTADELGRIVDELVAGGIENILALRGDPPRGERTFAPTAGGFAHAAELAAFIRARWDVCLAGASYPETHVEAADAETDLRHLVAKVAAGAEVLITQLFFDPAAYFAFVSRARAAGITVPIVPGIMPVTNVAQLERFTTMCGARIPAALREALADAGEDEGAVTAIGIAWAAEQCRALLAGGAPGLHFYTLNRSRSTQEIVGLLRAEGRL